MIDGAFTGERRMGEMGIPPSPPIANIFGVKRECPFGASSFPTKREDVVWSDSNWIYSYLAMIGGRSRVKPGVTLPTLIMLMTGGVPLPKRASPLNPIMLAIGGAPSRGGYPSPEPHYVNRRGGPPGNPSPAGEPACTCRSVTPPPPLISNATYLLV